MTQRRTFLIGSAAAALAGCARGAALPPVGAASPAIQGFDRARPRPLPNPAIVGEVQRFEGTRPPRGWMICDGRALRISAYRELYVVLGESCAPPNVPERRGVFYLPGPTQPQYAIAVRGIAPTSPKVVDAVFARRRNTR